jgi:hypothetical protein
MIGVHYIWRFPVAVTVHKHTELEEAMADLARAQRRTEDGLDHLRKLQERTEASLDRLEANIDRSIADFGRRVDESNRKAGEAVRRAGRLVEDIVAPSIRDVFRETFNWQGNVSSAIRLWRAPAGDPEGEQEFDAFAAGGDTFLLVSVKSTVSPDYIDDLLKDLAAVRRFFPEAENRRAYGAMASLYIDSSVVKAGERRGLYMLGLQTGLVTVLNSPAFKPAEF